MPIKVDVVDNSSLVRVKPKCNDEVQVKSDCNTKEKYLENKIDNEIKERKEADESINIRKQDKILFIEINHSTGTLSDEVLNLLISSKLNNLVYNGDIYYLCSEEGHIWNYTNSTITSNTKKIITVDIFTGNYEYSMSTLDIEVEPDLDEEVPDNCFILKFVK